MIRRRYLKMLTVDIIKQWVQQKLITFYPARDVIYERSRHAVLTVWSHDRKTRHR